ncbi:MAG: hypothetical protein WCP30_16120 [Mycobacteriaceae bacterium]
MVGTGSGARVVVVGVVVVGAGVRVVVVEGLLVVLGAVWGGATTVDSRELLLTITKANTRPATRSTAAMAAIHNQRGDFGGCGGGGGGAVGYPWPVCQTGGNCSVGCVIGAPGP